MPPVQVKQEFRAPADVLHDEIKRLNLPASIVPEAITPAPLVGTWVNCDHQTRGLVRLMIAANGPAITVHGFGACTPTPCDWGTVPGTTYADNVTAVPAVAFTAVYTFGFKQTTVVGKLMNGALIVETFDHFTDKSNRSDYHAQYVLAQ
jgi:hypothetical protein